MIATRRTPQWCQRVHRAFVPLFLAGVLIGARQSAAQESGAPLQLADRGPVFLAAAESDAPVIDVRTTAVFRRRVSMHLSNVPIAVALDQITQQTGIQFTYPADVVPESARATIDAANLTVASALNEILLDTNVDVVLSHRGYVGLIRHGSLLAPVRRHQPGGGVLTGRVTDANTGQPTPNATVVVEATTYRATTKNDGRYTIVGVPAGAYAVTARFLGYGALTKRVEIAADSVAHVDFTLMQAAASLEQVVVTGAGLQRRVEVGNAIATINADSITPTAPVTDFTDLISGRAANVQVLGTTGLVGDGPAIRIRGRGSITVSNDAILFIDGVRADDSPGGQRDPFNITSRHPTASRLNDLSPDEIESIEVLRGPSAATEYGTDAANGVIVVTTKRGHGGPPRWEFRTEQAATRVPTTYADNYTSWGHTTDGTDRPTTCPFAATFGGASQYAGTCTLDSVTHFQPLNHAATTMLGTGYRGQYDLQVSGGTTTLKYFFAGDLGGERGVLQMPPAEVAAVQREQGRVVPEDQLHPNRLDQTRVRATTDASLSSSTGVTVSAGYLTTAERTPDGINTLIGALEGPGYRDSLNGYSDGGAAYSAPRYLFAPTSSEGVTRFTGSAAGRWQPLSWLSTRATLGLDDASRSTIDQAIPGQDPYLYLPGGNGLRIRGLYRTDYYTIDLGATARVPISAFLSSTTAIGAQYYDRREQGTTVAATDLTASDPSLNGSALYGNSLLELEDEAKTGGVYAEETMSWRERLFVTAALREDAGSGFGAKSNAALYPKGSVSWVVLPEGAKTSLRLRAAYGQSGVQPQPGAALRLLSASQTAFGAGNSAAGDTLLGPGNDRLRPERSEEFEGGADIGVFGGRLTAELTVYAKRSTDALVNVPLAGSLGSFTVQENVGSVRNRGIEMSVTTRPIDTRLAAWDVTVSGSINQNRLMSLAPGLTQIDNELQYFSPWRQRVGYPLFGLWALPISYNDANHDGRIEPSEVTVGDTVVFIGPSLPTKELSVNTGLSLFGRRIRIAGQLDVRAGQRLANAVGYENAAFFQTDRALNDPHAPLSDQARAIAAVSAGNAGLFGFTSSGYVEDASFARLRELSITGFVPLRLTGRGNGDMSITLAGRNLALWTRYTGGDPESNNISDTRGGQITVAGVPTTALNHDVGADYAALPQPRYWVVKIGLGL